MCLNDVFSAIFAVKYLCVIALYWGENGGGEGRGRLKRGQCGGVCNFVILGLLVVVLFRLKNCATRRFFGWF